MRSFKVYVTGPYEAGNSRALRKNRSRLELVCRRVIIAGHVPICPVLMCGEWRDPRIPRDITWWVRRIYKPIMEDCKIFCMMPMPAGVRSERVKLERAAWREVGDGRFIMSEVIVDYLLNMNVERVLGS